jgi:hypothetical protein
LQLTRVPKYLLLPRMGKCLHCFFLRAGAA